MRPARRNGSAALDRSPAGRALDARASESVYTPRQFRYHHFMLRPRAQDRRRSLSIAAIFLIHLLIGGALVAALRLLLGSCLKTLAHAIAAPFRVMGGDSR